MTIQLLPVASCNGRDCHTRQPLSATDPESRVAQLASLGWRTVPGRPADRHFCPQHRNEATS